MDLQQLTWLVTVLSFVGGIATFLFRQIVIVPLQKSIDGLNKTIKKLEESTNRQLEIIDREIDLLKIKTTRHDEQLKTLFNRTGGKRNEN